MTDETDTPSSNPHQCANWLRFRHPWVDQLVRRSAGGTDDWLDEAAGAVLDTVGNGQAWDRVRPRASTAA